MRDAGRRVLAVIGVALVLAYPVPALLALDRLPTILKILWVAGVAAAAAWPGPSVLVFVALAPLLPIVPTLWHWPSVSLPSAWLWALLLPAWVGLARRPARRALPAPAMILLLIATASLVASVYPLHLARDGIGQLLGEIDQYLRHDLIIARSQRQVLSPLAAWATLAEGLGVLWLGCRFVGSRPEDVPRRLAALAVAIAAGACAVGAWAVEQWWTRDHLLQFWVEQDPYIVRVNASFTDVNALGAYLASSLAVVLGVAWLREDRRWRVAWLAGGALVLLGVVFTASRAAWLAAALALGVFVAGLIAWRLGSWPEGAYRRLRSGALTTLVTLSLLLVVLAGIATMRDVRHSEQRSYLHTLLYTVNLRAPLQERLKGRGQLWEAAVEMMVARPLEGIGLGRYYKDLAAWVPEAESLARPQENAHNYFLQVGAELGLPGLACLAWLFAAAIGGGLRTARAPAPLNVRRLALAGASGIAAFAVTSLTGHSLLLREGQLTFWALAALPLGLRLAAGPAAARGWTAWMVPLTAVLLIATLPARMAGEAARVDLGRLTMGIYDEERSPSGDTFRWTGPRAVFHVPSDARVLTLQVRSTAPFDQTLQVRHADMVIQEVPLGDHGWHPLRFVLPQSNARERFRRFELRVSPTWRPADDDRELGVMIGSIRWS